MSKANRPLVIIGCVLAVLLPALLPGPEPKAPRSKYFKIQIVDEQTGRGVPLVELRTVHGVSYYSDSNGIVAFHEPGLMDQTVFFRIQSHGYEFPRDGFGFRGKALAVKEGGSARLKIKRVNIAQRLYRVTGGGIYRNSLLVGHKVPLRRPVLNAQVLGSDSVVNAVYRGKVYWFWGDTNRPAHPLGNFDVPGATSLLPARGGLDPEAGVELKYFKDKTGFAKPTAPMPGPGATWIWGLVPLRGKGGHPRLFAAYVKVRNFPKVHERGLVEFNDRKQQFDKVVRFDKDAPLYPAGHPICPLPYRVGETNYVYFAHPYPLTRVRADAEHLKRPDSYEAFTCLEAGTRLAQGRLDRGKDGKLRYGWKKNTPPIGPEEQAKLIRAGRMKAEEALLHLQDAATGKTIVAHAGSVNWNPYRGRWLLITVEAGGTSYLGEVWYAEADTPLGPWVYARKVVTHDRYSFYNPRHHPMFDKSKGRYIFFEGTYSHTFSGNPHPTPRYDYNQVMYKLDLADSRLSLPVPIYSLSGDGAPDRFGPRTRRPANKAAGPIAFFAPDKPGPGTVPVYEEPGKRGGRGLKVGAPPTASCGSKPEPIFHALPGDLKKPPATTAPLYEFVHKDGHKRAYSTNRSWSQPGYRRAQKPICRVWRNPLGAAVVRDLFSPR
jgi:hypothetical protein